MINELDETHDPSRSSWVFGFASNLPEMQLPTGRLAELLVGLGVFWFVTRSYK